MTTTVNENMEGLISQLKALGEKADANGRRELIDALRSLTISLEDPGETIRRVAYLAIEMTVARIASDLGLWTILTDADRPVSTEELAQKTGADPVLLGRILRSLASYGMIQEHGAHQFGPSNVTLCFAQSPFRAGLSHHFDTFLPVLHELPRFLADRKYQQPTDPLDTPFQRAWKTDLLPYAWMEKHPQRMASFGEWMTVQRDGIPTWLEVYPVEEHTKGLDLEASAPLFVDIGGGFGHQSHAFRMKYPSIPGRTILQDRPQTLDLAIVDEAIDRVPQDFFQPQAVKGAKFYYLRNILHNYPDETCRTILRHTVQALGKSSVILIDEKVLPDAGVHRHTTQLDIVMMSGFSGIQRTKEQWYQLLESVGLKITAIYPYTSILQDSIIEAVAI